MAKTTAPLLSFDGAGQIAKTVVYSKWRGRSYARRYTIPANPNTAGQQTVRSLFAWLNAVWKAGPTEFIAPWDLFAQGQAFLGRNAYIGKNVKLLQGLTSIAAMNFCPGAKGGLALTGISTIGGAGVADSTLVMPATPPGWTVTQTTGLLIQEQDPQTELVTAMAVETNAIDPFTTLGWTGVAPGDYIVGAFIQWQRPDTTVAYGAAINDTVTVT